MLTFLLCSSNKYGCRVYKAGSTLETLTLFVVVGHEQPQTLRFWDLTSPLWLQAARSESASADPQHTVAGGVVARGGSLPTLSGFTVWGSGQKHVQQPDNNKKKSQPTSKPPLSSPPEPKPEDFALRHWGGSFFSSCAGKGIISGEGP